MVLKNGEMRFERMNPCGECGNCTDKMRCEPARQKTRPYSGVRFTSDGFDCALPVAIDSHSVCSYACLYCFADNLLSHRAARSKTIGQTSLGEVERLFSGEGGGERAVLLRKALRYDKKDQHGGFPAPVQLGAINDPCDHIERQQGWLLKFIDLAIKYNQPVRISTKGSVFMLKEYQEAVAKAPHLFWVAFSIITPDDELIEQTDRMAPNATERLATMKALSDLGCSTSLRFRPIMPGLSDKTPRYPQAYRVLIEKAAEAGARAISFEVGFVPGNMTPDTRWRWQRMSSITGVPFRELYRSFGKSQACMRPPPVWTENIMHAIAEVGHENGMTLGVSDPVWKQLTDTGCCCGMLPDDPVFGNWEVESATNQLLIAKETGKLIGPKDIIPEWAYDARLAGLIYPGVGPKAAYEHRHGSWAKKLYYNWNNPEVQRSPLGYFQGAMMPDHRDENGDLFYKYVGLERQYPEDVPFWDVPPRIK